MSLTTKRITVGDEVRQDVEIVKPQANDIKLTQYEERQLCISLISLNLLGTIADSRIAISDACYNWFGKKIEGEALDHLVNNSRVLKELAAETDVFYRVVSYDSIKQWARIYINKHYLYDIEPSTTYVLNIDSLNVKVDEVKTPVTFMYAVNGEGEVVERTYAYYAGDTVSHEGVHVLKYLTSLGEYMCKQDMTGTILLDASYYIRAITGQGIEYLGRFDDVVADLSTKGIFIILLPYTSDLKLIPEDAHTSFLLEASELDVPESDGDVLMNIHEELFELLLDNIDEEEVIEAFDESGLFADELYADGVAQALIDTLQAPILVSDADLTSIMTRMTNRIDEDPESIIPGYETRVQDLEYRTAANAYVMLEDALEQRILDLYDNE